jgi:outer membrane protein, heavy metal efflux system
MLSLSLRAAAVAAALLPILAMAAPLTLDEAVARALQRSETTRSARASVASASQLASAADQLPDPMLSLSLENLPVTGADRFRTTREGMTMKRLAVSQEWVSPAKRAVQRAAAEAMVAREAATVAVTAADTRLQTVLAYIDAYYAAENLKLGTRNEAHAREATQTARARIAAGGMGAQDVLALTSAQGMAADESADTRQQLASAAIALARWTGAASDDLAAPGLDGALPEPAFVDGHPAVAARKRELQLARQEAALTAANRRPNWTWEVAYGQRSGLSDMVSVGVTVPLPIAPAARQDRATAARLALVDKAEADLAEAVRAAQAEYRTLAIDEERLRGRIADYRAGVLAPATQRTAVTTAAYASNQASLAMVFEARHAELEAQRKLLTLTRDLARVQAQLLFKPLKGEDLR